MAPERLADAPYDGGADVYSLGIMLYEMLAGRRPFSSADLLELIRMHVHEPPRPLRELCPDLPPGIDAVVLGALAKDPENRPTAEELARDFQAALDGAAAPGGGRRTPTGGAQPEPAAEADRTATEQWTRATLLEPPEK